MSTLVCYKKRKMLLLGKGRRSQVMRRRRLVIVPSREDAEGASPLGTPILGDNEEERAMTFRKYRGNVITMDRV